MRTTSVSVGIVSPWSAMYPGGSELSECVRTYSSIPELSAVGLLILITVRGGVDGLDDLHIDRGVGVFPVIFPGGVDGAVTLVL